MKDSVALRAEETPELAASASSSAISQTEIFEQSVEFVLPGSAFLGKKTTMAIAELQHQPTEEIGSERQLHAVVLPYPAKGHSIPLLHFAKRLHSMGVIVTFVNTFNHLSKEHLGTLDGLDDSGMRVVPLGVPPAEGEGTESLPYIEHANALVTDAEVMVAELFTANNDAPPACIVSDMFLGWTQVIANKFKIPRYVLFASPASGLSAMLHMPELVKQGRLPIDPSKKEELVHDIPGVPPTRLADLPSPMQDPNAYFYPFYAQNCEEMHEAKGVLVNSFYELESSCIDVLRQTVYGNAHGEPGHLLSILPVGPMLPKAYFSTDGSEITASMERSNPCLAWLNRQPQSSVLFVSFGSVAVLSLPQIHELALGLEESGERFLLALRPPPNPENLLLLPEGFEERTKGRGYVHFGWAPQLYILSHRALAGFMTHCGWNSTLEAICRGVPMLAWPIQAEQAMNARFLIDEIKAAIELRKVTDELVTKEKISKAVQRLLTGSEGAVVRANAHKLKELALDAVEKGGSVEVNLENFIQELRS